MESTAPINVTPVVVKTKAPKKPTLNAKYSRFLAFGHWFLSSQAELISEEVRGQLFQKLMIFGSVEEQTAFCEGFFGEIKETNKTIRKMVAASKKPVKAPKAPRAKKSKAVLPQDGLVAQLIADAADSTQPVESEAGAVAVTKEKKPRAKKVKATAETEPAAADELVVAVAPTAADELVVAVAPVKEKKPRAKKAKAPAPEPVAEAPVAVTAELVAEAVAPVKEKKPRAKKADGDKPKKTKKAEPVVETAPVAAEESEDVQTRVVTIEGKEYLIDEEFNLYSMDAPHAQVGKYDQASEKAIFE
jgi:hypothetical protein